jgi:hypothetical protein
VSDDDKHNDDRNRDHDHAGDAGGSSQPGGKTTAAALRSSTAIASLALLEKVFANLDVSSLVGGTGRPLLLFRSREGGIWVLGRKRLAVEAGSRWAINPATFRWGWVYFDGQDRPHEVMVPISEAKPDRASLPDVGFEWQEQRAVNVRCLDGADAGIEATLKLNTVGGVQAVDGLIDTIRDRIVGGLHDGKIVPIVLLERDSYPHVERGKIWTPVLTIVGWMPLEGPAPAPEPSAPTPTPDPPPAPSSAPTTPAAAESRGAAGASLEALSKLPRGRGRVRRPRPILRLPCSASTI